MLGITIKEHALNAEIGVGENTDVQLNENDPFSYVDTIISSMMAQLATGLTVKIRLMLSSVPASVVQLRALLVKWLMHCLQ
ncbi:hypothetical protein [Sodalis sp.]|uniref:hypothetical protein n=1 Tax=Sodalis sp. (in: enterobacteria) TaxID=1898979 RepID=UPI003872FB92